MKEENIPLLVKNQLNEAIAKTIKFHKAAFVHQAANFSRKRKLDIGTMIKLLISMRGGSIDKELQSAFPHEKVSAAAFVKQRGKLSHKDFANILDVFNTTQTDFQTYKGYRMLAIDGTAINIARNPASESYMQNEEDKKGYNQIHANILYDILNNIYVYCHMQPQPEMDEIGALRFMLEWLDFSQKTIVIADRGYESYNTFAHFLENPNIDFLIRVKQSQSAMREIKKLPMMALDTDVSFTITTTQTNVDKENGYILLQKHKHTDKQYSANTRNKRWDFPSPYPMKFRVVHFLLPSGDYETIATSLPRDIISADDIKELYHMRWRIETAFRHLKYDLGLSHLHGKSDEFAMQEILVSLIMNNFCSRIVNAGTVEQKSQNIHEYKVNLKMAIELCKQFYRDDSADGEQLMHDIAAYLEPIRPNRSDKRNLRTKSFAGFVYRIPS